MAVGVDGVWHMGVGKRETVASSKKWAASTMTRSALEIGAVPTTVAWMLAIFGLALVPRLVSWGTIVTVDEAYHWFNRAAVFLRAVQNGVYADTNLVGHPGVTTMWLGALGVLLQRTLVDWGWASYDNAALYRGMLRFPVALVTAGSVALAYPLLRRLLDKRVALVGALLWASDPFLIAHGQLLHLDALLTSFITLSLLAALAAFQSDVVRPDAAVISWPLLVASGVAGGLALLTKSPSLILLPMVGLIAVVAALGRQHGSSLVHTPRSVLRARVFVPKIVLPWSVWVAVVALVWVALWPAAWVDLAGAIGRVVAQARDDGGVPHAWGNFFMGRAVADPGPLFYPVAVALRLTPWTLVGCVAALVLVVRRGWHGWRIGPLALLGCFALIFIIAMSVPPKKFDRYALPIFPTLDLLAAAGLIGFVDAWAAKANVLRSRAVAIAGGVLVLLNLVWYCPYYMSYYNPLLGGGAVASRLIPVGWGEGYEQVAAYLATQPDSGERPIATWFPPVLSALLPGEIGPLRWTMEPGKVDYAVLYIDQVQRGDEPEVTTWLRQTLTPVRTVRIHGIDYAQIYRIPPPVAHPVAATFGGTIALRGYDFDLSQLRAGGGATLTLQWQAIGDAGQDYMLFVHLLDDKGQQVSHVDLPAGGTQAATSTWRVGRYITLVQPIPIPAATPPGRYWLAVGLYDGQTFARVPFDGPRPAAQAPSDGEHALVIGPIEIVP